MTYKAELIKQKIREKGYTVEEVAKRSGMYRSTMYRKLNKGGESFTVSELRAIAVMLSFTPDELNSFVLH